MNIAVRYYTRSGNTKKLADAIAEVTMSEAETVAVPLAEKTDIVFLGTSYYAFDADEAVKQFILNNKDNIGKIVCFGTSAMMKSMKKPISRVADMAGVIVSEDEFHCRGEFGPMHKGRPDSKDIESVKRFAEKVIAE